MKWTYDLCCTFCNDCTCRNWYYSLPWRSLFRKAYTEWQVSLVCISYPETVLYKHTQRQRNTCNETWVRQNHADSAAVQAKWLQCGIQRWLFRDFTRLSSENKSSSYEKPDVSFKTLGKCHQTLDQLNPEIFVHIAISFDMSKEYIQSFSIEICLQIWKKVIKSA